MKVLELGDFQLKIIRILLSHFYKAGNRRVLVNVGIEINILEKKKFKTEYLRTEAQLMTGMALFGVDFKKTWQSDDGVLIFSAMVMTICKLINHLLV